jgi:hypothetical protein
MIDETELIGNEIIPIRRRRANWKMIATRLALATLSIALLYGFILVASAAYAQK